MGTGKPLRFGGHSTTPKHSADTVFKNPAMLGWAGVERPFAGRHWTDVVAMMYVFLR